MKINNYIESQCAYCTIIGHYNLRVIFEGWYMNEPHFFCSKQCLKKFKYIHIKKIELRDLEIQMINLRVMRRNGYK